jgi:hypothetical protein
MSEIKDKEKKVWLKTLGLGAAAMATANNFWNFRDTVIK